MCVSDDSLPVWNGQTWKDAPLMFRTSARLIDVQVFPKHTAIELGFEKIILKGGNMLVYFVSNQSSSYYNSRTFGQILDYIQRAQHKYQLVQRPNSLFVKCEKVRSVKKAVELLQEMLNLQS